MAPPKRQLKVSTRSLPKHLAGRLQDRLEKIREDPSLLVPTCDHSGGCARSAIERSLRRVQRSSDSRGKLKRLSRRGPPVSRAYAGALDILFDDQVPMLAGFPNPFGGGEVKFAQRGNAKKEVQAGVQNYTDKGVRLLAYLPYAKGFRGAYMYSVEGGVLCSGRTPAPPDEFLRECAAAQRPALVLSGDDYVCPHLRTMRDGLPRAVDETHVAARWGVGDQLRVCRVCAGGGNLSTAMRRYAVGPKINGIVQTWVELRPQCNESGAKACHFDRRIDLDEEERESFDKGKLTDAEVLQGALKRSLADLEAGEAGFVLAGGVCYGKDTDTIVASFDPAPEMKRALAAALKGRGDIVLDALTPSKVLSRFWEERGIKILQAACGNADVAKRVFEEAKPNESPPSLVQRAVKLARAAAIEEALPAFEGLSAEAAFADRIARAHRQGGAEAALREVEEGRTISPSAGAIAWAFLSALDKAGGRQWQFSKVETERGAVAREAARALLDCRADEYADALRSALQALGVHEDIEPTTT